MESKNTNLEFLIVGIARESQEDLHKFYKATAPEVYGMALSIVKDTYLASEVLAETYKRIATMAYLFNTEMSAEYWLLDMAKNISENALHDPDIKTSLLSKKQDNMSMALMELINNGKNDRAAIIISRLMSELSFRDIARLLWYKTGSCKKEYTRGINRLSEKLPFTEKGQLATQIKDDIIRTCPDVWNKIINEETGPLAHISHEELNLDESDIIYSEEDKEKALEEKHTEQKKKKKKAIILIIAVAVILVSSISAVLVGNVLKKQKEAGKITVDVQFGNKTALVQIEDNVFYQNNKKDNHLWVYDLNKNKAKELLPEAIKELITDGEKLYFRNLDDGKIYSLNPDGSGKKLLTETSGTCITHNDGKIYFSSGSGISYVNTDGTGETLLADISEGSDDYVYFTGQELTPFRYRMKFSPEGDLYFSAGAGKGLYKVTDFDGKTGIEAVSQDEIYTFDFYKNSIYYDYKILDEELMGTIYLYKLDRETQLAAPVSDIVMGTGAYYLKDNIMYYDGIVNEKYGIYKIDLSQETLKPEKISDKRASDMYIYDDKLYIYYPGTIEEPGKYLVGLPLSGEGKAINIF